METSRRSFFKAGAVATLVLAAGGGLYRYAHPAPPRGFVLDGAARAVLAAVVPVILDGVLPADPAGRTQAVGKAIAGVDRAIRVLPLALQGEVENLFGLLALAPARRWLAGVPDGWDQADVAQVAAWLQRWRGHRLGLLRDAYQALHDLVLGSWYAEPANWAAIGYPGPIAELA